MTPATYSYIRFSSKKQADGGSLERQTKLSKAYCERNGLTLDDTLNLQDLGISAYRGTNVKDGALGAFLEACKLKKVAPGSKLIIESLDRLSRGNVEDALPLFLSLLKFGITIVTLQPEREYPPGCSYMQVIEPLVVLARANEESETKSHRVKAAWKATRQEAALNKTPITSTCPEWLHIVNGAYEAKPGAQDIIQQIFQWASEGLGTTRIVNLMEAEPAKYAPFTKSGKWTLWYIAEILTNRAVIGEYQPRDQDRELDGPPIDLYPAMADTETFEKVQYGRRTRQPEMPKRETARPVKIGPSKPRRKEQDANLFTHLAYDAATGNRFNIRQAFDRRKKDGSRGKQYVYLVPRTTNGRTTGNRVNYEIFENAFLQTVDSLVNEDLAVDQTAAQKRKAEMVELEASIVDLTNRKEQAEAQAADAKDFKLLLGTIATLDKRLKEKSDRLEELRNSQPEPVNLQETKNLAGQVRKLMAEGNHAELVRVRGQLKRRIAQIVERIDIETTEAPRLDEFRQITLFDIRHEEPLHQKVRVPTCPIKLHHVTIKLRTGRNIQFQLNSDGFFHAVA